MPIGAKALFAAASGWNAGSGWMKLIPKFFFLTHEVLGCRALAIKNEDPNKTFCISFRTVPQDSTGVAHIIEHSVLMGSKKYPVRDVFGASKIGRASCRERV